MHVDTPRIVHTITQAAQWLLEAQEHALDERDDDTLAALAKARERIERAVDVVRRRER